MDSSYYPKQRLIFLQTWMISNSNHFISAILSVDFVDVLML